MKKAIFVVSAFLLLMPFIAGSAASEAKGQTYIDSMVTDNINLRRREYVYNSRRKSTRKKTTVVRKKTSVRKKTNVRKKKPVRRTVIKRRYSDGYNEPG